MRLLVTGAAGLLGATVTLAAERANFNVTPIYRNSALRSRGLHLDLRDRTSLQTAVGEVRPDWVIHCAAITNVDWAEDHADETMEVNGRLPGFLARAVAGVAGGVVFISTDSVFDGMRGGYVEGDPTGPINVYARSKLAGENAVRDASNRHIVLRTNMFGWNALAKESLAEWILRRVESGDSVPAFTDVTFSPLLVNDLSDVILGAIELGITGTYHVGASDAMSKFEFAALLARVAGHPSAHVEPVRASSAQLRAPRPLNTSLISTKIESALGRAMPSVETGLTKFIELRRAGYVDNLKAMVEPA